MTRLIDLKSGPFKKINQVVLILSTVPSGANRCIDQACGMHPQRTVCLHRPDFESDNVLTIDYDCQFLNQ